MPDDRLTEEELAALDLVITALRNPGGESPGGFINIADVARVTRRVVDATRRATPYIQIATTFLSAPGGPDTINSALRDVVRQLPPGVTLDQLIELRRQLSGGAASYR
jgi:hypothetical protein